jgi:serine/threonine protein phosphatase 1
MGRVFCSADWHGCWNPASQVIEYLKPDDKLYFLGDAIDRGPDGIKIFQTLVKDPRVTFLRGNHEDMMARSIPFLMMDYPRYEMCGDWFSNGGEKTSESFWDMDRTDVFNIRYAITNMPTEVTYTSPHGHSVIMEHAGYTPFDIPHRSHDPLWDREHFYDEWGDSAEGKNVYLVHGHTPVQYLKYFYGYQGERPMTIEDAVEKRKFFRDELTNIKPEVIQYCEGHKFDIDMCTIASGRIALMDLDTFEIIYFDKE